MSELKSCSDVLQEKGWVLAETINDIDIWTHPERPDEYIEVRGVEWSHKKRRPN